MAADGLLGGAALSWWDWIAPVAVQAGLFAALVLVLDRLLARRGWPVLRHTLWLLAALRFVLPPTLASPVGVASWLGAGAAPTAATPAASNSPIANGAMG